MCILCIEIQKQRMTYQEVASAYREFTIPEDHKDELHATIEENYDIHEVTSEITQLDIQEHYLKVQVDNK